MWAQIITSRLKPGREHDLLKLMKGLEAVEQEGSGLLRSMAMVDQKDPLKVYTLVLFESEEKARARENDPRRQERLTALRELMADAFEDQREFADLNVVYDRSY